MKKIIFIAIALLCALLANSQSETQVKGRYTYEYLTALKRLDIPADTVYSKVGLSRLNGSVYVGDGTKWTAVGTNATQNDSIWKRQGVVLADTTGEVQLAEPTVINESSPQILTGLSTVFKALYTYVDGSNNPNVGYAESADGRHFTRHGTAVIAGYCRGSMIKVGSNYYYYGVHGFSGTAIDRFVSTDMLHWTLDHANVIVAGAGGSWNSSIFNSWVIKDGSTWKFLIDGLGPLGYTNGYYTSTDGFTTTPYAGNPVLTANSDPFFVKIGSTFWEWGSHTKNSNFVPTDAYRYFSSDMEHWACAPCNSTFHRMTADEGVDSADGQVGDIDMVEVGGVTYMYYTATPNGVAGAGAVLKLAIANMPISQLVTTNENAPLFNNWESQGPHVSYMTGNVGIGRQDPKFALDIFQTTSNIGGIRSPFLQGTVVSTFGANGFYNGTKWTNDDSTNTSMDVQALQDAINIVSLNSGTSSPTPTILGGWKYSNGLFWNNGHVLVGNSVDDGSGAAFQVTGNSEFGNIPVAGLINGTYYGTGFGGITHNIGLFSTKTFGNGITTGDFNFAVMTQLPALTTGQNNIAMGQGALAPCTTCLFNTVGGELSANSANTASFLSLWGRTTGLNIIDATHIAAVGDDGARAIVHATMGAFFGPQAGYQDANGVTTTDCSHCGAFGPDAEVTCSSCIVIGSTGTLQPKVGFGVTSPTSSLHDNGSFALAIRSTATSVSLTSTDYTLLVTATGQTETLPTAVGIGGRIYVIKLTVSGTGTVQTTGSEKIDGSTTYSLSAQYKFVTLQSDNANWNIIANN